MEITVYQNAGAALVRLKGRVVLDECDRLKSSVVPLISPQLAQINLDLSEVEFIDSAGLGALVGIKVSSNKHRTRLALLNPSRAVSDILMVSKLDSIFDILTGPEASAVIQGLALPHYQRTTAAGAGAPARPAGVPAMPSAAAHATLPGPAGDGREKLESLCRQAVDLMRQGDYERAAEAYRAALAINPDYLPALNNLAIVCEKRPDWHPQAIMHWQRVLDLSTRSGDAKHIERAQKHLAMLKG